MKKIKPSDLRREAAAMIRDGSMPPLETVLQAVAEMRKKYGGEIKASRNRRGKREQLLANVTKSQIVKF
jgi:hypothetical protein